MAPIIPFIERHFRHPLVPLFLFFGAILTLLGITSGVSLVGIGDLEANGEFRYISVALGFFSICLALFIYYRPPKHNNANQTTLEGETHSEVLPEWVPSEVLLPWLAKRDYLTPSQREILNFIEEQKSVSFSHISESFPDNTGTELFYRLEQLRLLGFVGYDLPEEQTDESEDCFYSLNTHYADAIKKRVSGVTLFSKKLKSLRSKTFKHQASVA